MLHARLVIGAALALTGALGVLASPSDLYIDCEHGSDTLGNGSLAAPWATLSYAASVVRSLSHTHTHTDAHTDTARGTGLTQPLTLHVLPGTCFPTDASGAVNFSAPLLTLTSADNGTPNTPITWQADGGVLLSGGTRLDPAAWVLVDAAMNMYAYNLTAAGIAQYGFGSIGSGGLGQCTNNQAELFFDGQPMVLARYPNIAPDGTWQWMNIDRVLSPTNFTTQDPRPARWAAEQNPWLHGYWGFDWADNYVHGLAFAASGAGAAVGTDPATPMLYTPQKGARFYGVNLQCELDVPSEYYIDADAGMLYFIPPYDIASADAFLSMTASVITASASSSALGAPQPTEFAPAVGPSGKAVAPTVATQVASATGPFFQYVTFRGFSVMYSRGTGVMISDANAVVLDSLTLSNHGHSGLSLSGWNSTATNLTIVNTGCSAASAIGGDEMNLIPGNLTVASSRMASFARFCRTYQPGIGWGGVGNTYADNTIEDAPHCGMLGTGNNNLFAGNYFADLCTEVSDSGAWYSGRSWVRRGNVIVGNTFVRINNTVGYILGTPSVQAIYLDDELAQVTVINNTIIDSFKGLLVGGGRDNYVAGNTFIRNEYGVSFDNRGMNWQAASCTYNATYNGSLVLDLFAVNYQNPPYSVAYPPIVTTLHNHPCVPVNNSIIENTYCGLTNGFIQINGNATSWYSVVANNTEFSGC